MTDIPEDIMQAAREIALEWHDEESLSFSPMRDDFARAILGERQRCAALARSMPTLRQISPKHIAATTPSDVADAILAP